MAKIIETVASSISLREAIAWGNAKESKVTKRYRFCFRIKHQSHFRDPFLSKINFTINRLFPYEIGWSKLAYPEIDQPNSFSLVISSRNKGKISELEKPMHAAKFAQNSDNPDFQQKKFCKIFQNLPPLWQILKTNMQLQKNFQKTATHYKNANS